MAAAAVVFDGTLVSNAESETDGGTWDQWDTAKSPTQETDFVYQFGASNASISTKVGTSEAGVELEATTAVDYSTTPRVALLKVIASNFTALNTIGPTAMVIYIGSGTTTDRYNYYVHGSDTYPKAGGFVFIAIDPNVSAYRDATDGTPSLTAVDYYAVSATFTGTAKTDNVAMDSINYVNSGKGMTITAGDGASEPGSFLDFLAADEGNSANRWAVMRSIEGVLLVLGTLTIGSASVTEFTAADTALVFPDSLTDVGFSGLAVSLAHASTIVAISDCEFTGRGRSNKKVWFSTEEETNGLTEAITAVAHGYLDGEAVLYSKQGGTEAIGLTDATEYWVEVVTVDSFSLHTSRQNAMTAAAPVNLTASTAGNGEQHSFRRQPDSRPTLTVTSTLGTVTFTGCKFARFRLLTLTSGATMTACKFVNCSALTQAQAQLDACTITTPLLTEGEAFVSTPDLADIADCVFTIGAEGHAIEITAAGSYAFDGNLFTGYWAHGGNAGNGAEFDTTSGVDAGTDVITTNATHGLTTGDAVYYNDGGGSATPGPTDGARYYVDVLSTTTLSLHVTKEDAVASENLVALTSAGGETHALYSSKATILNNSGGAVTITIGGGGGGITVRNAGNSDTTTVLTGAVTTLLNVKDENAANLANARVLIEAADGTGPLPFDDTVTITASGTLATVVHTAHGMVNGDLVVIRSADNDTQVAYKGVFTISAVTANGYQYTMGSSPSSPALGSPIKATGAVVSGLTDGSGNISASRSFSSDQPVSGEVRKATGSPRYKEFPFLDTIDNLNGLTKSVQMTRDE